jgi:ubiquinone/menaquinone biosynthesis C-methylase UbiE
MISPLYSLLEIPWVYSLSQLVLAPGAGRGMKAALQPLTGINSQSNRILDVGCGPQSLVGELVQLTAERIFGLDQNLSYLIKLRENGHSAAAGSADYLPYADDCFGATWCVGLLHHLTDFQARKTIREMVRVTQSSETIVVVDAVFPKKSLRKLFAQLIRKFDRGRRMRNESESLRLFPDDEEWRFSRFEYTLNGLECVAVAARKQDQIIITPTWSSILER